MVMKIFFRNRSRRRSCFFFSVVTKRVGVVLSMGHARLRLFNFCLLRHLLLKRTYEWRANGKP